MTGEAILTASHQARLTFSADCGHDQVVVQSKDDGRWSANA